MDLIVREKIHARLPVEVVAEIGHNQLVLVADSAEATTIVLALRYQRGPHCRSCPELESWTRFLDDHPLGVCIDLNRVCVWMAEALARKPELVDMGWSDRGHQLCPAFSVHCEYCLQDPVEGCGMNACG